MRSAAWAVINLDALKFNLNRVRELAADSKVMVVIKANGYGHGLCEVAEALKEADAFAVARIDEAVQLRKAGFEQRIVILEGFSDADELRLHSQFKLEAVIYAPEQLILLKENSQFNVPHLWLKVDTGMHRLGIEPKEYPFFYKQLSDISPISIMTHFACADELDNSMTIQQLALFNQVTVNCVAEKSLANSATIMGWPEIKAEWVRPGIMLYGISPFEGQLGETGGLKPVMNLYSKLISIKEVKKGAFVGYGGSYRCSNDSRIGVVAIGYGDGYPRHNKSVRSVLLNGQRVSLVGRVSMDMITVDLSEQPEAVVGDVCQLWGEGLPVEEVAKSADTIAYTLVCGITRRVEMHYRGKGEEA
jgi:alanine racemase